MKGVILPLVDGGLSILQYDDDTIPFMKHDFERTNMTINFPKNELFCFGVRLRTRLVNMTIYFAMGRASF
jgi:hypothetical protein